MNHQRLSQTVQRTPDGIQGRRCQWSTRSPSRRAQEAHMKSRGHFEGTNEAQITSRSPTPWQMPIQPGQGAPSQI
eukprot:12091830-Karenia_brevis.AAC.1